MSSIDPVRFGKVLADETRQKIMELTCCGWVSVGELVDKLQVTQPTVSHHLAVLREAGLVKVREQGKQTFYTLNQEQMATCCGTLVLRLAPETETARTVKAIRIIIQDE